MTIQVNLLPMEYRLRAKRARRFRRWVALSIAVMGIECLLGMSLRLQASRTRDSRQQLTQLQEDQRRLAKSFATLASERRALDRQIALAEQLSRKHRWSRAFEVITTHLPAYVVLDKLTTDPPEDASSVAAPRTSAGLGGQIKGKPQAAAEPNTAKGLILEGVARDHEAVASLMGALDDQMNFGTCELKSSSRRVFMGAEAVSFTIHTRW
jgi:Tfp pilus assembly protein PilN